MKRKYRKKEYKSCWGRDFLYLSKLALVTPNMYRLSFSWVKWPGHGVKHLSQNIAEVKEIAELYFYSLSLSLSAFMACSR
jgi:hypothetical protein